MVRLPEKTRHKILTAALKCFENHGYKKTTVDEIALAAGVGKGTIYLHFADKDNLFIQVIKGKMQEKKKAALAGVDAEPDAVFKISRLARNVVQFLNDNPMMADTMSQNPLSGTAHLYHNFEQSKEEILDMIEEILVAGVKKGEVAPVNTRIAAFVLFNAYEAFFCSRRPHQLQVSPEEYINFMQNFMRKSILLKK